MSTATATATRREVEISRADLPLCCPLPSMSAWNSHPRVFLAIEKTGAAQCPYCGTRYQLQGGPCTSGH